MHFFFHFYFRFSSTDTISQEAEVCLGKGLLASIGIVDRIHGTYAKTCTDKSSRNNDLRMLFIFNFCAVTLQFVQD